MSELLNQKLKYMLHARRVGEGFNPIKEFNKYSEAVKNGEKWNKDNFIEPCKENNFDSPNYLITARNPLNDTEKGKFLAMVQMSWKDSGVKALDLRGEDLEKSKVMLDDIGVKYKDFSRYDACTNRITSRIELIDLPLP